MLVAFVRQLANDHRLLRRFGSNPQPIARAVGLRWPDEAREIVKQSLAHVASDQFDPNTADARELITYTRALAALKQWLDPALAEAATRKVAGAINGLAAKEGLSERELSALAETVGVFGSAHRPESDRDGPGSTAPRDHDRAKGRLQSARTSDRPRHRGHGSRPQPLGAPPSRPLPGSPARPGYRFPVGQGNPARSDRAPAHARSRQSMIDPGEAPELLSALPRAIAKAAVAKSDQRKLLSAAFDAARRDA